MRRFIVAALELAAIALSLLRSYRGFTDPAALSWRYVPHLSLLAAGLMAIDFVSERRKKTSGQITSQHGDEQVVLSRPERAFFKVMGAFLVMVGVGLLSIIGWLTWNHWLEVRHWPTVIATVVGNETVYSRPMLTLRYNIAGSPFSARVFSEAKPNNPSDQIGATRAIIYNPDNPGEVDTIVKYDWDFFKIPLFGSAFCSLFLLGGVAAYRSSYGWRRAAF